jgi:hypothetical protein
MFFQNDAVRRLIPAENAQQEGRDDERADDAGDDREPGQEGDQTASRSPTTRSA